VTDEHTVTIPNHLWSQSGYSMLKEIERLFPDEQYTFRNLNGPGTPIVITFTTAEAAAMMRLVWSGYERD
jgi:hypothetical protein